EMGTYTGIIKQLKHKNSLYYLEIHYQSLLNLMEYSKRPGMLIGKIFNEEKMIPLHREARDISALFHLYFNKVFLNYIFCNYEEALEHGKITETYLGGMKGSVLIAQFYFYYSLAGLALYNSMSEKERKIILKKVRESQKKFKIWACHCPVNFLHEYYLLEAEIHRILGHNPGDYYDLSIKYAQKNEFIHEEAIANELAGKFYLTKGNREKSTVYLKNARYCYERWGAVIKVRDLDERYKDIFLKKIYSEKPSYPTNQFGSSSREGLDLISVMKAIGALSGEIILGNLLRRLMDIVMENAGAEKAFLILKEGEKLIIEAKVSAVKISLFEPVLLEKSKELSLSIVYYVARTFRDIVLDNAFTSDMFNRDEYIREKKPKSILCTGLIKSGILTGILYLENNHTEGAFTAGHLEILKMISSQAAISIENAKLYSRIEESEKKYRSIFENATEGIFQLLPDRSFLTVNPAMAKIFGYSSPEEFLANISGTEKLYVAPGQREEIAEKLKETGIIRDYQARGYRKDRHIIYVSINAHEVRDKDNNLLYYEGIIEDITQKKQAEDLKIAKEAAEADLIRLATAIEQAGECVLITDREGVIEYVNPAFEDITGYGRDEIKGKKPAILKSGKHDRLFYENIWNTITSGDIWTGHFINRRKDGSLYELDASITPVRDSNGNIINYVSVRRDVTDKLRLERQLRQSQKMEAIGTLSGGIAHDFNNILAAIIGNTEMALNKIADKSPGRDNLERIMKSCYRAKDLITQILSFSRQKEQESKPVNIAS
ncbi:MAG: PAS domain S-box protein, partial [Candidatus Eremiobacterota bacterium]